MKFCAVKSLPAENSWQAYGEPLSLDHEAGKIGCVKADAAGSNQSMKCSVDVRWSGHWRGLYLLEKSK